VEAKFKGLENDGISESILTDLNPVAWEFIPRRGRGKQRMKKN
jgi:hypothetical protein